MECATLDDSLRAAPLLAALSTVPLARGQAPSGPEAPLSIGPFGGSVATVASDPADALVLLAVKFPDSLVRSDDGGVTFAPYGTGLPAQAQLAQILRHPLVHDELYAPYANGVYRSLDDGQAWAPLALPANGGVQELAFAADASVLLAAAQTVLLRSIDGGGAWSTVASGTLLATVAVAPADPARCYAGSLNGILASSDGGASWSNPSPTFTSWVKEIAVDPSDALRVLAGTTNGVWESIDGGASFTKQSGNGLPGFASVEHLLFSPLDPAEVWLGLLDGVWRSGDGGSTWAASNQGLEPIPPIPQGLDVAPDGTTWLASSGGLFRRAPQGASWAAVGFPELAVPSLALAADGRRLAGAFNGVYAALPGALLAPTDFLFDFGADTRALLADPADPDRWLSGGVGAFIDNAVVRVLTQNGAQVSIAWEEFGAGAVVSLARDAGDPLRVLGGVAPASFGGFGLIGSLNGGQSFAGIPGSSGRAAAAVAFDPLLAGHAIALFENHTWAESFGGAFAYKPPWPAGGVSVAFAFDPFASGTWYRASTGGGWTKSTDAGASWTPLGKSAGAASSIALAAHQPGLLFLSDAAGQVWISADGGASFAALPAIPAAAAGALVLESASGALLVGTAADSAWEIAGAAPFVPIGSGLGGSGGFVPRHFAAGGLPELGNASFSWNADRLLGGALGVLYAGLGEVAVPIFGGTLYAAPPDVLLAAQVIAGSGAGAGVLAVAVPIPAAPELAGVRVVSQVFALDAGAPQGVSASAGLATTLWP